MKHFDEHALDRNACRVEVLALRKHLAKHPDLPEQMIRGFFRKHRHLSALCGIYNTAISRFDRLAWEYDLFGDFACDLIVGDSVKKAYCFIECEDAGPKSLFIKEGKKSTRAWSPRFEHGYSQIVDWFYKLRDREKSDEFDARFGSRSIDYTGLLLCGRSQYLNAQDRRRLDWRTTHVIVDSRRIVCVSYDELADDLLYYLLYYLSKFPLGAKADEER
jgi:hypothetical protein